MSNPFQYEDLLRSIEANDPNFDAVSIDTRDIAEVSYELFDRVGHALAYNTNIQELALNIPKSKDRADLVGWLRFLELIGRNRSITYFHYISASAAVKSLRVNSAMFLRRFFERNGALEFISLKIIDPDEAEAFASALANRETTLGRIVIHDANSIELLRLIFEKNPAAIPKEVRTRNLGNEGGEALARFLESANNVGIHELDVSNSDIGPRGLLRIARALARRDSPLDSLSLELSSSSDTFLVDFATAFWENPDSLPNELNLWGHICEAGGRALGTVLVRRGTPLEHLFLHARNEGDHSWVLGVVALLQVLGDNPSKSPKILFFHEFHNDFMEPMERLLQNQMCSQEVLGVYCSIKDTEDRSNFQRRMTSVCCNETSISTTYNSNHTLIGVPHACPQLKHYLTMNGNPDKKKVACIKVYDTHFARDFQPDFFAVMQPSLLSKVLAFVNQAFADHEVFTSEAAPNGNEAAAQATNNSLSIHFLMLKEHPFLLSNRLINMH
mmetsp:Transcript_28125/g.57550  ORF Transcript_28125/g.57550 Transcript_28125/m.57550 type:complete len:500 (-) Transcript_28125:80-1579(-)